MNINIKVPKIKNANEKTEVTQSDITLIARCVGQVKMAKEPTSER